MQEPSCALLRESCKEGSCCEPALGTALVQARSWSGIFRGMEHTHRQEGLAAGHSALFWVFIQAQALEASLPPFLGALAPDQQKLERPGACHFSLPVVCPVWCTWLGSVDLHIV